MAAERLTTITEAWIRDRLQLKVPHLGDVRSLSLPGTYEEKIRHLGTALRNFVRLKSVDLSCNALTSVEGLLHLKMLERLNLYYNCISSVKEVKELCKLPALRELDLRLNPLTKNDPHYRLYLVHAMPNLRKLDDCPVRDTERKAAIMQFSSDPLPHQKSHILSQAPDNRSTDSRVSSVERITKRLSFADSSDDIVLNFGAKSSHLQQETEEAETKSVSETESCSSQKQEPVKSILRSTQKNYALDANSTPNPPLDGTNSRLYGYTQSKVPQTKVSSQKKNSTSLKGVEGPRVTFDPYVEKRRPDSGRHKHKDPSKRPAKGHFTPNPDQGHQHDTLLMNVRPPSPRSPGMTLSDPSNPVLHPPRASYSSRTAGGAAVPQKTHNQKRGSYRKPLEMLLNLVDKHWKGERSLHHNSDFLSKAVQILSMMEDDISSREDEIRTLKGEVEGLKRQADVRQEEHKIQVRDLSVQLEDAQDSATKLNEQLKIVLEENVNLQKQLIKLEQQYLKSMMKTSPVTQIKEAQTEVDELRREIEGLRQKVHDAEKVKDLAHMLQESHRSLVATNERLLGELRASTEQ